MRRTIQKYPPFHADHVGSLLRPACLKRARSAFVAGKLTRLQLTQVEDDEVRRVVEQQKACGIHVITDGVLRRTGGHYDFFAHLHGIAGPEGNQNYCMTRQEMATCHLQVVGPVSFNPEHPFLAHYRFLHQAVGDDPQAVAKQTLPSPCMLMYRSLRRNGVYQALDAYCEDLAQVYVQALNAFYAQGCRYLQLDDTFWSLFGDVAAIRTELDDGTDPYQLIEHCVSLLNRIMQDKPKDMYISLHVCSGDLDTKILHRNPFADVIAKALGRLNVNSLFLEYADAHFSGLETLRAIGAQTVVLGVITSETGELEDARSIKRRINDASLYLPLNQLALSPMCGFASAESAAWLTEEQQWNKLRHVVNLAHEIWVMSE
ncbi:5-methyltetrahydropteroyltriglutamate--homocysteine S-methyltransferase [Symbiopectobacterium purcellii]|uniref:5-methyltetrahydropteroyltriglutamate--homocysteine S-methyltransferase n=1 Tax=Symbiopectobacterium purcellii TaxID=2871826 RepID=A0ABX9AJ69_9ENTR|nr:5-methyltetrahydropteroyltriglutamate--homocysteine S-methyltransferase [Symbiopectobacterium purcellii]QZN95212.1 5-methyltetrahydropteroyltriglutamate--homocysteine S-methyltransferase [Symbiopectobacterium purcellii]